MTKAPSWLVGTDTSAQTVLAAATPEPAQPLADREQAEERDEHDEPRPRTDLRGEEQGDDRAEAGARVEGQRDEGEDGQQAPQPV